VIISDNKSTSNQRKIIQQRVKFQQEYLDRHGYAWSGPIVDHLKPRGAPWLPMWSADYLGQRHQVSSSNIQLKSCSLDDEDKDKDESSKSKSKKTKRDKNKSKKNDTTMKIAGLCPSHTSSSTTTTTSSTDDENTEKLSLELEVISTSPKIFLIRNFLSSEEADLIVSTATPHLRQSEIGSTSAGAKTHRQDNIRKSSTAWLPWSFSPNFLKYIYYRAADLLQIPREYFDSNAIVEDLQVVRYLEDEKYQGHYDWGDFGHNHTRFITLLMYLNDPVEGGETAFLNAPHPTDKEQVGFKIHPGKGSAILFYNLLEDGNGDVSTFHASLPVVKGVKWLSNLWVWDPFFQEMQYKMLKLLIEQQTQQRRNGKAKSISGIEETLDFGNEYDDEL
jgi:prolyl 4-hydroxylase